MGIKNNYKKFCKKYKYQIIKYCYMIYYNIENFKLY